MIMQAFEELLKNPAIRKNLESAVKKFGYSAVMQTLGSMPRGTVKGITAIASDDFSETSGPVTGQMRGAKKEKERAKIGAKNLAQLGALMGVGVSGMRLPGAIQGIMQGAEAMMGQPGQDQQAPPAAQPELEAPQQQQPAQLTDQSPGPQGGSLTQQMLQGIDIQSLEPAQTARISTLARMLESLEGQGKGPDDEEVRNIKGQIDAIAQGGVAGEERARFEDQYGEDPTERMEEGERERLEGPGGIDQEAEIERQQHARMSPEAQQRADPPQITDGDLVETRDGREGRVQSVDHEKGIAKIKIGKKVHSKSIDSLNKKDWNDLKSAPIEQFAYNEELQVPLIKFRKGPWYAYQGVDPKTFERFSKGQGTAKTEGEFAGLTWWKGKNPSLGAAFWKEIRDKNPYARLQDDIDPESFFRDFPRISPELPWKIPEKKDKKKKTKRKKS